MMLQIKMFLSVYLENLKYLKYCHIVLFFINKTYSKTHTTTGGKKLCCSRQGVRYTQKKGRACQKQQEKGKRGMLR